MIDRFWTNARDWSDEDRESMIADMVRNLADRYDRADDATRTVGRDWYGVGRKLADRVGRSAAEHGLIPLGMHREYGAAIIAILSPRKRWETNVAQALQWAQHGHLRVMRDQSTKLYRLRHGEALDTVVGGPKVRSFWANLSGDHEAVTVDIWALRAAFDDATLGDPEYGKLSSAGRYVLVAEAYRRLARSVGESPSAVQAIVWIVERGSAE